MDSIKISRGRPRRLTNSEASDTATDSGGHMSIICPCCGSGSGEHGTGLFRNTDEKKQHMLHCSNCKKTFTYDVQYLNRIYGGRKGTPLEIHENINFYKTFKYLKEIRGIDEKILTQFLFSDGDEYRCFIYGYDDNGIKHRQELVYDVSINKLIKKFDKNDSNFFYTELVVDNASDVFFVVESVVNGLSLASLGFNSVVIFTATNIEKFAMSYILSKRNLSNTILCLDFDKNSIMQKYETLNYRIFDFSQFETFLDNPKIDINDLFLNCKDRLFHYLNDLKNNKIVQQTNTELACEDIEKIIDLNKNNCVIIPTGAGKTYYITTQLKKDKNAISFHPTIENVDEMGEAGINTITQNGEKYENAEAGQSMCFARVALNLEKESYEVKSYSGGGEERIKDKNCYLDEVDESIKKIVIPFIRMYRLKIKKFSNNTADRRVYMPTITHDNEKIKKDIQEDGLAYSIDFYYENYKDCQFINLLNYDDSKNYILIGDKYYHFCDLINPKNFTRDKNEKCNEYYLELPQPNFFIKKNQNDSFDEYVKYKHSRFLDNSNYYTDLETFINWHYQFLFMPEIHVTFPEVIDENGNIKPLSWDEFREAIKNPATRFINEKNHSEWFCVKLVGISTQVLQRIAFNAKTIQMFTATDNKLKTKILTDLGSIYNFEIKRYKNNYFINVFFKIYFLKQTIGKIEIKKWASELEQRGEKLLIVTRTKEKAQKKALECSKFINTACTLESKMLFYECENSTARIIFSYPDSPFMRGSNKFRDVKYCLIDSEIFFPINSIGWYNYPSNEMAVENGISLLLQILGRLCRVEKNGEKMIKKIGLYNFDVSNDYNILMGQSISNELKKLSIDYSFINSSTKEDLLTCFFSNDLNIIPPHIESIDFSELQNNRRKENEKETSIIKDRFFEKFYEVSDDDIIFFDTEVYKNLFILVTKRHGDNSECVFVNPSLTELQDVMHPYCKYFCGFNNDCYDNAVLYKLLKLLKYNQNYSVIMPELKKFSDAIISNSSPSSFGKIHTYLDFFKLCSKTKSLSKIKYELNYQCLESPFSFDDEISPDKINDCVKYCVNDVLGLEYAFFQPEYYQKYQSHKMLCKLNDIQVCNSTNTTTGVMIFGKTSNAWRKTQLKLPNLENYIRKIPGYENAKFEIQQGEKDNNGVFVNNDQKTLINRGGENKCRPGYYENVVSLDVDSMYVTTFINTGYFGDFTDKIRKLRDVRLALKRKNLNDVFKTYKEFGEFIVNEKIDFKLASDMLKLCLNSLYGLSSANFDNFMRLENNDTNLIANLGNIMMNELYRICTEIKNWKVIHIKTDGIKIADCTDEMIQFCVNFAKMWGYNFTIDEKYNKFIIIDKSNYIGVTENEKISSRGEFFNNNWLEPYMNNSFDYNTASVILQVKIGSIINHTKNNAHVGKCIRVYPCINGDEYFKIMPNKENFDCIADTKKPGRGVHDVFKFESYDKFDINKLDRTYYELLYQKIISKIASSRVLNIDKKEADDLLRSFFARKRLVF